MDILPVHKGLALEHLNKWLPEPKTEYDLPARTFMAVKDGNVIGLASLRLCEGPGCYLESLATNPEASSQDRSDAIDALTLCIIETAKKLGFSLLRAHTTVVTILDRAKTLGFEIQPDISFFRRL